MAYTKQNKELVFRAKTPKKPFQRSGVFGKGFPRFPQWPSYMEGDKAARGIKVLVSGGYW